MKLPTDKQLKIVNLLCDSPNALEPWEIARALGVSGGAVREKLQSLLKKQWVYNHRPSRTRSYYGVMPETRDIVMSLRDREFI